MAKPRIVELSHRIIPGKEHFQLETRVDDVTNILPEVKHRPDVWYVLGAVTYCTHVGTHIEVPFHHFKEGADVADFPISPLVGPLMVLDFRHKKDQQAITLEEIKAHDARVHEGDIVFIWTGADKLYRTERWNEQPHLTVEANCWLIEKRIACLGTDAAGLEVPGTDYQPNHQAIFRAGIPMIESATNLDQVQNGRYIAFILPLPIEGLEASPLRIIAIAKEHLHELG
jgi:arylformamidase